MDDEVSEYIQYILNLAEIKRPKVPDFPISAYTENEYIDAIREIMKDYEFVDFESFHNA